MGRLIVIEGLDGSGKSTQIEILKKRLEEDKKAPFEIKLPYYSDESSTLVKMYLDGQFGSEPGDVNAYAASTFYAADRYASFKKYWSREYNEGRLILADRYTTSNAVHQMTKLPENMWDAYLEWLFDFEYNKLSIPSPDCVIFLDMPVEISQRLMSERYDGNEGKKDVHERNVRYLLSCYETAKYAAEKLGWHVIKCSENGQPRSIDSIADEIYECVKKRI